MTQTKSHFAFVTGRALVALFCAVCIGAVAGLLTKWNQGWILGSGSVALVCCFFILCVFGHQTERPDSDEIEEYAHEGL